MEQRLGVQITFGLMYAGVSFIFLLSAIWLGLWLADRIVAPVGQASRGIATSLGR